MEIFPGAPIYTLLHDAEKTRNRFKDRIKETSFLDFKIARINHRIFIPFMPMAAHFLNLEDKYDLIISDTAGYAKGVSYGKNTKHISYIHTPLRYAWEQKEFLSGLISSWKIAFGRPILNYLKNWDYRAGQRPDKLIANSRFIAGKIKDYYGRDAEVIYPPVDTKKFYREGAKKGEYYLAVGRLLHYKRFDLIIKAFAKIGLPLKIVGSGPEEKNIREIISQIPNIEFVPFVKDENDLRKLYNSAKALIFPQVEDFGLVAAEAQACGTPVIAYAAGGALEIIKEGKTGLFFKEQSPEALAEAVLRCEKTRFDPKKIAEAGKKFSKEVFKKSFLTVVKSM